MKSKVSKNHSVKGIEFDVNLLLRSLSNHADHLEGKKKLTMRQTTIPHPLRRAKPKESALVRARKVRGRP
jgi:hypothetical protein